MSTKATIFHGDNFHFYRECFDDYNVYLQIDDPKSIEYEVSNEKIVLQIPYSVWETIKLHNCEELKYYNMSDGEIETMVIDEVKCRIDEFNKGKKNPLLFMSMVYGLPSESEKEQIENGIKYYSHRRDIEKKMYEELLKYKKINKL